MNDPHVVALLYALKHDKSIDYSNAQPLAYDAVDFSVSVEASVARFEFNVHFSEVEEARNAVSGFIKSWILSACLARGPQEFDLIFLKAEVIDRAPTRGTHITNVSMESLSLVSGSVSMVVGRGTYPQPVEGIAVDDDVEAMQYRFNRYREQKDTLTGVGYFCFTVLKGKRQIGDAAGRLSVSTSVLTTLSNLSSSKGGPDARKHVGLNRPLSDPERIWIEAAMKALIWRAAEVASNSTKKYPQITLADLPMLDR